MSELSGLFAPDRAAVVGGSGREGAVGRAVSENLTDDFDGEVLPVDPNDERIPGRLCYDSVAETDADLAVVVVLPAVAVDVVETAVVETIRRLSQLATDFPAILELDVTPLVATPDDAVAIDLVLTADPDAL